jgi:hypothetical protein
MMNNPTESFRFESHLRIIIKLLGQDLAARPGSSGQVMAAEGGASTRRSKFGPPRDHRFQMAIKAIIEAFPAGIWAVSFRQIFDGVCEHHSRNGLSKPSEGTVKRAKNALRKRKC